MNRTEIFNELMILLIGYWCLMLANPSLKRNEIDYLGYLIEYSLIFTVGCNLIFLIRHVLADGKLKFKRKVAHLLTKSWFRIKVKEYGLVTQREANKSLMEKIGYRD